MSLPDLYGNFFPDLSRFYQAEWLEKQNFPIYKGETFKGDLLIFNGGTEKAEAFDVNLYISTDKVVDTRDRYIGTYTFTDGIDGLSSYSTFFDFPKDPTIATLPNSEDSFWQDQDTYYLGAIVDPDNAVIESNEDNNSPDSQYYYFNDGNFSIPITIQDANLPIASFTQYDNTLQINLSEPAPEAGFTIDYQNITREDYLNGINIPDQNNYYQYSHRYIGSSFFDLESNRFYIERENYYDLADYKYYDTDGGHYDPAENKYFNADGSYYDVGENIFYDADGNATELTDNSAEYTSSSSSPRHYLPTGGYISLISGVYYDALGGYIDETTEEYFFREGKDGLGNYFQRLNVLQTQFAAIELGIGGTIPSIATPDVDYEMLLGENVEDITNSTITIAPGETTATIDFNFFSDLVFDPNETIEFELLENEEKYIVGRSTLYRYFEPTPNIEDLKNPRLGDLNFSVDRNAKAGTDIGHVNFSDPQGDELTYSIVNGGNELYDLIDSEYYLKPQYRYTDIDLGLNLIETSNQDLDGDGIHPFSIDPSTGTITLSDFDDLDREAVNNVAEEDYSQLYHDGYYQLFVRVADEVPTEEDFRLSTIDLYETSIVNVQVVDIPTTSGNDEVVGSLNHDIIKGLAGDDTINGLAGNDSINGGADNDELFGSIGDDVLVGSIANDILNGGVGDDLLAGSAGRDILIGSIGNDTLNGGIGYDKLNGGAGEDVLIGLYGNDTLNGGEDNDILRGGTGIDRLAGNEGEDVFILDTNSGKDIIVDFEDRMDSIKLPVNMSFADLNIFDASINSATIIRDRNDNEIIAVLQGVDADLITETDFV